MQISRMYYGGEITTDWIAALWWAIMCGDRKENKKVVDVDGH